MDGSVAKEICELVDVLRSDSPEFERAAAAEALYANYPADLALAELDRRNP
jgi:hypothetical protein